MTEKHAPDALVSKVRLDETTPVGNSNDLAPVEDDLAPVEDDLAPVEDERLGTTKVDP